MATPLAIGAGGRAGARPRDAPRQRSCPSTVTGRGVEVPRYNPQSMQVEDYAVDSVGTLPIAGETALIPGGNSAGGSVGGTLASAI